MPNRKPNDAVETTGRSEPHFTSQCDFTNSIGVVPSTVRRWINQSWLDEPLDIGGRKYFTNDMLRRFKERAARGEFAGACKPPVRLPGQNPRDTWKV